MNDDRVTQLEAALRGLLDMFTATGWPRIWIVDAHDANERQWAPLADEGADRVRAARKVLYANYADRSQEAE